MGFIPTVGAVRVDIQCIDAGQQIHNVIWATREAAWTDVERAALASAIETWWTTSIAPLLRGACLLTQITVVNQDTQNAPSTVRVVNPQISGTDSGADAPLHMACCATLRTELRGRNYRGRFYLGGIGGSKLLDQIKFTTTFVSNVITAMTALKTVIDGLGAIWVVVSHYLNKTARANGVKTPITAVSVDQYVDSQRRRLGLRGV